MIPKTAKAQNNHKRIPNFYYNRIAPGPSRKKVYILHANAKWAKWDHEKNGTSKRKQNQDPVVLPCAHPKSSGCGFPCHKKRKKKQNQDPFC